MAKSKSKVIVNNNLLKSAPPDPLGYTEDLTPSNRLEWFIYHAGEGNGGGGGGGSEDLSIAKVTLDNSAGLGYVGIGAAVADDANSQSTSFIACESGETVQANVILYKGKALLDADGAELEPVGNIVSNGDGTYTATGDGTLISGGIE